MYNTDVPDDWRKVNIVTVYIMGRKCETINYRIVLLMFVCYKILEHIVASSALDKITAYCTNSDMDCGTSALVKRN